MSAARKVPQSPMPSQSARNEKQTTRPSSLNLFGQIDREFDLAEALAARTGKDLFAGVTGTGDRKATARIQIIINKLDGESAGNQTFASAFERIYAEPLHVKQPKGKTNGSA